MTGDTKQDLENKGFSTQDDFDAKSDLDSTFKSEQVGVARVEAAQKVWGKYTRWLLFISLFFSAYVYSLDGYCAASWNFRLTSAFDEHSLLSAVATAQAIIISLGKILFAKWSDVFGRPQGVALSLFWYCLGFILLASATDINAAAAGFIFYALGYSGLQILIQVVIADTTTLRYRGLTVALFTSPFLINFYAGSKVATYFAPAVTPDTPPGYPHSLRWGYGMFCIVFPAALAPLIGTLWWGERKAVREGLVPRHHLPGDNVLEKLMSFLSQIDIVGLVLLLAGLGLILEPTALAGTTFGVPIIAWDQAGILAPCYVIGALCWPALFVWEWNFARHPILPKRVFLNRSLMGVLLFSFFDFVSFYLQYPYLASFIEVCTNWSQNGQKCVRETSQRCNLIAHIYFLYTQTVSLTLFGIIFGAYISIFKHYKIGLLIGAIIRLIGIATMIAARGHPSSVAGLVLTQLVQGLGGGILSIGGTVAAQAAVPHQDTAIATAIPLLFAEIGNAVGNSIAGAIWRSKLPGILTENLTPLGFNETQIASVFGSAVTAATYPFGSPERDAIISSYESVMHTLLIAGTVFAIPPIFAVLMLHNYSAGDSQNAVESRNLKGERVDLGEQNRHENETSVIEGVVDGVKEVVPMHLPHGHKAD